MKVVQAPPIQFKCSSCGAVNEGEEREFSYRHTMPPTWHAQCAFCRNICVVSPSVLIACHVGSMSLREVCGEVGDRLRKVGLL